MRPISICFLILGMVACSRMAFADSDTSDLYSLSQSVTRNGVDIADPRPLLIISPEKQTTQKVEGDSGVLKWDITNNTAISLTVTPSFPTFITNKKTDLLDVPMFAKEGEFTGTCIDMAKLPSGERCTLYLNFSTTPNDGGDDFGSTNVKVVILAQGNQINGFQNAEGKIIVTDNANVVVPEPSSLGLFGTGLVALAGIMRRKLRV